jgi:hypothetical protein
MSLDYTPITVPNPPAQIIPVEQKPSLPPSIITVPVQGGSSGLYGTTEVKSTTQNNNNAATNNTEVNNRNTVIQNIRGAQTQVGDISFESTSFYANASTSIHGDLEVTAGIIVPLGGHKIRRSAAAIALAKADAAKGGVCKSIMQSDFTIDTVDAIYPKNPEYRKCVKVKLEEVKVQVAQNDLEVYQLQLEIAELKAKIKASRETRIISVPAPVEHNKEVRGLW